MLKVCVICICFCSSLQRIRRGCGGNFSDLGRRVLSSSSSRTQKKRRITFTDSFKVYNVIIIKSFKKVRCIYWNSKGSASLADILCTRYFFFVLVYVICVHYISLSREAWSSGLMCSVMVQSRGFESPFVQPAPSSKCISCSYRGRIKAAREERTALSVYHAQDTLGLLGYAGTFCLSSFLVP